MLTAFASRSGVVPEAWGASGLVASASCGGATGGGGSPSAGTVQVTFNVQATTVFGGKPLRHSSYFVFSP